MIESLLEKAKRTVDAAEVFYLETTANDVSFEAGKLKNAERKTAAGLGLRIIHEGRIGFSSTSDTDRLDEVVENARASARFGKEAHFSFPGSQAGIEVETYDTAVEHFSPSEAVVEGRRTVELLGECCPKGLTDIEFSSSVTTVRIVNTSGLDLSYRSTDFFHSVVSLIVEGDSILWIGDGGHFGTLNIRTDDYVRKISNLARLSERKAPKVAGTLPVIFTAEEMPVLLGSIEMGVNGLRLLKGDSPLIGRECQRVLGPVTILDDPSLNHAPGSCPFDDEGMPSTINVLFKDGVFRTFLFDLETAGQTGRVSTGSANRGMLSTPGISSSNLVMSAGTSSLDDMIAGIDRGIIVYGVLGGGQSNMLAGDFALNIMLGFLVEHGEITGRLVDTMVSGNVYAAFNDIAAMGADVKPVGTVFVPDVMFSGLSISSR